MCEHKKYQHRPGISVENTEAHENDHKSWSRRSFLTTLGMAGFGGSMMLGTKSVRAMASSSIQQLLNQNTDRTLILINMDGGNDGLNTIIPFNNDLYYQRRPTLGIAKADTLEISDDFGLHQSMPEIRDMFLDGDVGIVQNVGYQNPNLSHFRSTDIWATASDENQVLETGWMGRYLADQNPDYIANPPAHPLAIQIGGPALLFKGQQTNLGMAVRDLDRFNNFLDDGIFYSLEGLPQTTYGDEMWFMRTVVNSSFRYGAVIRDAAAQTSNTANFPEGDLSDGLQIVSRLMKGGLSTRLYMVSYSGFDTHANQVDDHASLLGQLSQSVAAFYDDLPDGQQKDDVLIVTFSEFGRRIEENGSQGTDHGSSAPLFVIGKQVNGGIYGDAPDLANPDPDGNPVHNYDFRQVYGTVLTEWLGLASSTADDVLNRPFETIPFLSTGTGVDSRPQRVAASLKQNYPNPVRGETTIEYSVEKTSQVEINLYSVDGRRVATLESKTHAPGSYSTSLDTSNLAAGTYIYALESNGASISRRLAVVR